MNNLPKIDQGKLVYSDELHASFIEPPGVKLSVFKSEYFDGLLKQDVDTRNKWLDLVGNAYGRINLLDEDDVVVTWVPPMVYGFVSKETGDLEQAASDHRTKKELHKGAADAQLLKAIEHNIQIQKPPRSHIEQWKKLIIMFDSKVKSILTVPVEHDNSEESYEDW